MARRRTQPRVTESEYAARDVSDDFRARDTSDSLDPIYEETPNNSAEEVDADPVTAAQKHGTGTMNPQLAALAPPVRAVFTYLARLARSLTEGPAPDIRPVPPDQRGRGVVLVVQILPDGRRVVFR